jgi:hypothetical protein
MADLPDHDSVRLNEDAARRLLQRATELDASLASESSVAELREAARGAGISDEAFQRALDEVRAEAKTPVRQRGTFAPRRFVLISAILLLMGIAALVVARLNPQPVSEPAVAGEPAGTPVLPAPPPPPPR